jgi:Caspase domain
MIFAKILTCLYLLLVSFPVLAAKQRVALVIGNGAYQHTTSLKNAPNDGKLMTAKLTKLGFKVIGGTDLTKSQMQTALRQFGRALSRAKTVALFYAGHGLQVDGKNFLVPIDANISVAADLEWEAISMQAILRQMQNRKRTSIIMLDACRDNPLSRRLARTMGTRSSAVGRGLARMIAGAGSFVAFATAPDQVALDGETGDNSPFTTALAKHIETPGLDIAQLFRRVRVEVDQATSGQQVPWSNSSLRSDFQFRSPKARAAIKPSRKPSAPALSQYEITYWNSVKDSSNPRILKTYLDKYPKGQFAGLAQVLIETAKTQRSNERKGVERERAARDAIAAKREAGRKQAEALKKAREATRANELKRALEEAAKARAALKQAEERRKKAEAEASQARADAAAAQAKREAQLAKAAKRADEARQAGLRATESKQERARVASLPPAAKTKGPVDKHAIHRQVQKALQRLGCYKGKIDGLWGAASQRALSKSVGSKRARSGTLSEKLSLVQSRGETCKTRKRQTVSTPAIAAQPRGRAKKRSPSRRRCASDIAACRKRHPKCMTRAATHQTDVSHQGQERERQRLCDIQESNCLRQVRAVCRG